jgi:pyrimidine operon attenuation protein/uracil phosphoribosyltransferase
MGFGKKKMVILSQEGIKRAIRDIARQVTSRHKSLQDIVLVGIRTGGAYLAFRLREEISKKDEEKPLTGVLDINLYRDDWTRIGPSSRLGSTEIPFSVDDKIIVLVDDVLFTGRTVRAAMDALIDLGRPKKIELAVLVDRGEEQRELPIKANYVAKEWPTSPGETVKVYLKEEGLKDRVVVEEQEGNKG